MNEPLPTEWGLAPGEHQIYSDDDVRMEYRRIVNRIVNSTAKKSLMKKPFFVISTNVLCAEVETKYDSLPPEDRDLYLPLEITITKWNLMAAKEPSRKRQLITKHWMINPGNPPDKCRATSLEHRRVHKIDFDPDDENNPYIEKSFDKIAREINNFLAPDRTVYSLTLRHLRQDLGCLKWLNREVNYKMKPIRFLDLVDLYVVLVRYFKPEEGQAFGCGIAKWSLESFSESQMKQCDYHEDRLKEDAVNNETQFCTLSRSYSWSDKFLDDMIRFADIFGKEDEKNKS